MMCSILGQGCPKRGHQKGNYDVATWRLPFKKKKKKKKRKKKKKSKPQIARGGPTHEKESKRMRKR